MSHLRTTVDRSLDIILCLASTVAAVGVTIAPVPSWVTVLIVVPFLLFSTGYTVTVGLFPRVRPDRQDIEIDSLDGLVPFDRLVLSVALSAALAIIVGVNINFTPWDIRAQTVISSLAVLAVVASTIGLWRRRTISPADERLRDRYRPLLDDDSATLARVMVTLAVTVALLSVAAAAVGDRGESYTEFGLLTATEGGEFVATGHPSNLTVNESTRLFYTITNREGGDRTYSVVVQLQAGAADGSPDRVTRLTQSETAITAGRSVQRSHTITPPFTGTNLRLQYLLYVDDPPADPSVSNAYRHVHLWVDVAP